MKSFLDPALLGASGQALSLTRSRCSSLSGWPWTGKVKHLGTLGLPFPRDGLRPAMEVAALSWVNHEPS